MGIVHYDEQGDSASEPKGSGEACSSMVERQRFERRGAGRARPSNRSAHSEGAFAGRVLLYVHACQCT
jgi:hypothetical protein